MNNTNDIIDKIWDILNDKSYYSISPNYAAKKLNITKSLFNDMIKHVEKRYNVQINIFKFNDRTYVGLESRRIDYKNDKKNGTNHIEKLIEQGVYD